MKKVGCKSFVAGLVVCALVMNCFAAYADAVQKSISAVFGQVKLVVDGKPVEKETLLYDGTTYVPLRAAAEALGKGVGYDDATKTAYIGQAPKTSNDSLKKTLTQAEWVGAKQEVALSTGINMKYVEMGKQDGEVIIFLHGMTDNSRSWSLIAPYFTDTYHVYLLDQRGHGSTDKPDMRMYPVSLYASDAVAFMDAMNIKKAHIVGHSLGSMIAQNLAVNYPERVNRLVLESSTLVEFDALGRDLYDIAVSFGNNAPDDEFMAEWYYNPNPVDEEFLGYEMKESQNIPPHAWRAITKGCSYSDLTPFMDELKAPTLILWGAEDGFFGEDNQKALRKAIPHAETVDYEGIGHNIQWEIPEKMAADVRAFLEK